MECKLPIFGCVRVSGVVPNEKGWLGRQYKQRAGEAGGQVGSGGVDESAAGSWSRRLVCFCYVLVRVLCVDAKRLCETHFGVYAKTY